ncbi:MAG: hypothetical protein JSR81_01840 [Proteobacteria bacterium]|nr:hypothetical protein [Pseudomonadota bacterium]
MQKIRRRFTKEYTDKEIIAFIEHSPPPVLDLFDNEILRIVKIVVDLEKRYGLSGGQGGFLAEVNRDFMLQLLTRDEMLRELCGAGIGSASANEIVDELCRLVHDPLRVNLQAYNHWK